MPRNAREGTADVTVDEKVLLLQENEMYVPLGAVHRLRNPARSRLS